MDMVGNGYNRRIKFDSIRSIIFTYPGNVETMGKGLGPLDVFIHQQYRPLPNFG